MTLTTSENYPPPFKIVILTTIQDDWGGSEELWKKSIPFLQKSGHTITVFKKNINFNHPAFKTLSQQGIELIELEGSRSRTKLFFKDLYRKAKKKIKHYNVPLTSFLDTEEVFYNILKQNKPDLVIVSQSINFDGLFYAFQSLKLNIPYAVIAQKAVDFYWPQPEDREYMSQTLVKARSVFFVSHHNLRLTEEQFGTRLINARIVYNPVKLSGMITYPSTTNGYKLACIARLFLLDKGQDILIRILAQKKWKDRPISVSFIGTGEDLGGLKDLANLLEVSNIDFKGQVEDIENLWKNYHAFILPSRSEGLPLAMIEAMAAGRPVIVTKAGGNEEVIEEGVNGFIGHINEESFDEAMERAWAARNEWEQIGEQASKSISSIVERCPEKEFAGYINAIVNDN